MNRKLIMILVCLGFVSAAGAEINFDQGVDVKSAIQAAAVSEVGLPDAKFGMPLFATRDCKKITFGAEDPLASPEISLHASETTENCIDIYHQPPMCSTHVDHYSETTQIVITAPRILQPGQKEVFEVCLFGWSLSMKPISPAYKYSIKRVGSVFRLTPPPAAVPAAKGDHGAQGVCLLVMDSGSSCMYKCQDGSYVSRPSFAPPPIPGISFPATGCTGSIPDPH